MALGTALWKRFKTLVTPGRVHPPDLRGGGMPRRSLILAGGGIKVAFQAGVLQVWLDEAGLTFDHVDAASGGVFNLAMMCQGMTGLTIADNWRKTDPKDGISFNAAELLKLAYAESLFTLDAYRENVFGGWGLDWDTIRASRLEATFNVFNFSTKEVEVLAPARMTEDYLVACVSLPMWFPPVRIGGHTYIDAVYMTDANIEEAIRRGADELWVIWTVSDKDVWHPGFVATYFQVIETTADGHYKAILARIRANNEAIAAGRAGEFGRRIDVKELKADVPLHYLIDFSQDRMTEAVNLGVKRARQWCRDNGIALPHEGVDYPTDVHAAHTTLSFRETMKGHVGLGARDFEEGARQGRQAGTDLEVHLTIAIDGVNRFVTRPEHDATITGTVVSPAFGGERPVTEGRFNLFVDQVNASEKRMLYRLFFTDGTGRPLTLSGRKEIRDDPGFDLWHDTTTLYTVVLEGHVPEGKDAQAPVVASGVISIHMLDFLRQLTTFRVTGPTLGDRVSALTRFGRLFLGKLWDVYATGLLTSGPV
jgi:predicted patatin/cPLA2 family phospholipase